MVEIKVSRGVLQLGRRTGSNTTRSRLVALGSVPFTRIPGLLARGRTNDVLVDSCPGSVTDEQTNRQNDRQTERLFVGHVVQVLATRRGRISTWAEHRAAGCNSSISNEEDRDRHCPANSWPAPPAPWACHLAW